MGRFFYVDRNGFLSHGDWEKLSEAVKAQVRVDREALEHVRKSLTRRIWKIELK